MSDERKLSTKSGTRYLPTTKVPHRSGCFFHVTTSPKNLTSTGCYPHPSFPPPMTLSSCSKTIGSFSESTLVESSYSESLPASWRLQRLQRCGRPFWLTFLLGTWGKLRVLKKIGQFVAFRNKVALHLDFGGVFVPRVVP